MDTSHMPQLFSPQWNVCWEPKKKEHVSYSTTFLLPMQRLLCWDLSVFFICPAIVSNCFTTSPGLLLFDIFIFCFCKSLTYRRALQAIKEVLSAQNPFCEIIAYCTKLFQFLKIFFHASSNFKYYHLYIRTRDYLFWKSFVQSLIWGW